MNCLPFMKSTDCDAQLRWARDDEEYEPQCHFRGGGKPDSDRPTLKGGAPQSELRLLRHPAGGGVPRNDVLTGRLRFDQRAVDEADRLRRPEAGLAMTFLASVDGTSMVELLQYHIRTAISLCPTIPTSLPENRWTGVARLLNFPP